MRSTTSSSTMVQWQSRYLLSYKIYSTRLSREVVLEAAWVLRRNGVRQPMFKIYCYLNLSSSDDSTDSDGVLTVTSFEPKCRFQIWGVPSVGLSRGEPIDCPDARLTATFLSYMWDANMTRRCTRSSSDQAQPAASTMQDTRLLSTATLTKELCHLSGA